MSEDKSNEPDDDDGHNSGGMESTSASPDKKKKSLKNPDLSELDNDESDDSDKVRLKREKNKQKMAELSQMQNEKEEAKTSDLSVAHLKLKKFRESAKFLFAIHQKIYKTKSKFYRNDIVNTKIGVLFYEEFSNRFDRSGQQQSIISFAELEDFEATLRQILLTCGKNDLTFHAKPMPKNPLSYVVFPALDDFKTVMDASFLVYTDLKHAAEGQIFFRFKKTDIQGRINIHLNQQPNIFWKSTILPKLIKNISETCPSVVGIKVQAQKYFDFSDTIILYLNTEPEAAWEKLETVIEESIPAQYRSNAILPFTRRKILGVTLSYLIDYVCPGSIKKVTSESFITLIGWISRDAFKRLLSKHSKALSNKNPAEKLTKELELEYANCLEQEIHRNRGRVELDGTLIPANM